MHSFLEWGIRTFGHAYFCAFVLVWAFVLLGIRTSRYPYHWTCVLWRNSFLDIGTVGHSYFWALVFWAFVLAWAFVFAHSYFPASIALGMRTYLPRKSEHAVYLYNRLGWNSITGSLNIRCIGMIGLCWNRKTEHASYLYSRFGQKLYYGKAEHAVHLYNRSGLNSITGRLHMPCLCIIGLGRILLQDAWTCCVFA